MAGRWYQRVAACAAAVLAAGIGSPGRAAPKYDERQVFELTEIAASEQEPEAKRAKAIRDLANTDIRTHLAALRRLMRQERSLDIRLSAACTLAYLGDAKAPKDLLLASAYDGEHTANCSRSDVLIALGHTHDSAAEMHLERALKAEPPADEPGLRLEACRALGLLGTPGARKLLLAQIREGSAEVRLAAVNPLAQPVGPKGADPESIAALTLAARTDPDEKVAEQAMSALLWNGADGAGFFRLLEADPSAAVRARAARVMNRHYCSQPRLQRLRAAMAKEKDTSVLRAMRQTLEGQRKPGESAAGG